MKRFIAIYSCLLAMSPINADARTCAVQCQRAVVVNEVVAVAAAVPVGIPVASYSPYYYSSAQQQPVNVTVNLNTDQIAQAVVDKLNGPAPQKAPPLPAPPPIPAGQPTPPPVPNAAERASAPPASMFAAKCARCHQTADAATGKPSFAVALDCPTKLRAIQAIVTERMPKGGHLTADEVGKLVEELSK